MTGEQRVKIPSSLLLGFGLLALGFNAAAQDDAAPASGFGSVNCTFRADPDEFLSRGSRVRRAVFDSAAKFSRMAFADGSRATVPASSIPHSSFIDDEIFDRLAAAGVQSAPLATDGEFVRRIYLDLIGRLPAPEQINDFLGDQDPAKRSALIDRLLYSPEFVDRWTMWIGDLVQNNVTAVNFNQQISGRNVMHQWLRVSLAQEKSVRDMAWELITAQGNNYDSGPANFTAKFTTPGGPVQDRYDTAVARTASAFLGIGAYDCLLCHDGRNKLDALNLWGKSVTRMDAYRMAAHFSRINIQGRATVAGSYYNNSFDVTNRPTGTYDLNTTFGNRPNRVRVGTLVNVTPEYRLGQAPAMTADWRATYAEAITADPMFARNFSNRIWRQMFNLGLVEPVDGLDPARLDPDNPPPEGWTLQATHPKLLELLAKRFEQSNYNIRDLLRVISESSAYQLSSRYDDAWKVEYVPLFARHYPRRLEGEEVHDALVAATGVVQNFTVQGFDETFRWAVQLPDPSEPRNNMGGATTFMSVFTRGNRDTLPRSQAGSVLLQLTLMNSTFLLDRIRINASPNLRQLAAESDNRLLVDELWLRFLARRPTAVESAKAMAHLSRAANAAQRNQYVEDLAWAALNKVEFLFSY